MRVKEIKDIDGFFKALSSCETMVNLMNNFHLQ
jgi:hypothetical protein